jgi:hypothetical protein
MLRNTVIRGCLLCGLAAAAAAPAGAQLAGRGHALAAGGPDTGGTGSTAQFQLQHPLGDWRVFARLGLRPAAAEAELGGFHRFAGGHEAGAYVDVRQAEGALAPVRELSAYAAVRAGAWRWQLSLSRDLEMLAGETAVGIRVRRDF